MWSTFVLSTIVFVHLSKYCSGLEAQFCIQRSLGCNNKACEKSVSCYHGDCTSSGQCECDLCWQGDSCNEYVDRFRPVFLETNQEVLVSNPWNAESIFTARVYDGDLGATCPVEAMVCECAETKFSIVSGNSGGLFFLNNMTGDVYVREAGQLIMGQTYTLVIAVHPAYHLATNETTAPTLELKITIDNLHHHLANELEKSIFAPSVKQLDRSKRQAEGNSYLTEFNFTLVAGETETMQVGRRVDYSLLIMIPKIEAMDMTMEIFTREIGNGNYTPTLVIFNVEVQDPLPPGVTFSNFRKEMLLCDEINTAYDHAIVPFGEVKNTNDGLTQVLVTFSVTQIRNPQTIFDMKYFVTVGVEYDKETLIWVGQSELTVHNSTDNYQVKLELEGPSEISLDSAGIFMLKSHVAVRSDNITVEIVAPEEKNVITIGNLGVYDFDVNYDPVPQSVYFYNTTMFGSDDDVIYTSAQLYLGVMTNVGEYEEATDPGNVISITFAIYALSHIENLGKEVTFTINFYVAKEKISSYDHTVIIIPRKEAEKMVKAKTTLSELTTPTAAQGDMVMYKLWTNLTNGGYADYVLEVDVQKDQNQLPRLEACSARLWKYPDNFDVPYLNTTFIDPEVKNGKFLFRFNRIHVTDQRNPPIYNDSMIYVHLIVKISSLAVNKPEIKLTPELFYGTQGKVEKKVDATGVVVKQNDAPLVPAMEVKNAVEWDYLYVGGAIVLNVTMFVPQAYGYSEISIEMNGESEPPLPIVRVCRAELSDVGRNLPCLRMHQDEVNQNFTKYSLSNAKSRKKPDIATVILGDVGALPVAEKNHATVSYVVELPIGSIVKEDEIFPMLSGLSVKKDIIWGMAANYSMRKGPPPGLAPEKQPDANYTYIGRSSVLPGHLAEILISVHTKIQSISNYSVEIEAVTKDISMCGLKVISFGRNLPCIDISTEPFYVHHDNPLDGNKIAGLKFPALSNIGFRANPEHDTLTAKALIRVSPSCKDTKVDLKWRVVFGGGLRSGDIVVQVDQSHDESAMTLTNTEPKVLRFKPAYPNKAIAMGTPLVVDLEVSLEPDSLAKVLVNMKSADSSKKKGAYDMCLGGIWFRGKNYPCFSPVQVRSKFAASDSTSTRNDSALYDLGLVCNTFVDSNEEENKVTVRVAMRPADDGTLKIRDALNIEGYATVGSFSKKINTLKFTIAREAEQIETVNPTLKRVRGQPVGIRIHQRIWVPFNITIPIDSLVKVQVQATAPLKDHRALMTVHKLRLVSGGANIPCPMLYPQPVVEFAPIVQTTQSDVIKGYVGYFTNLGLTHKMNMALDGDDDLTVEVEVEMSDHPLTDHETEFDLTFSAEVGKHVLEVKQPMKVWRDGLERADLNVSVSVDDRKVYQSGDPIEIMVTIKHTQKSTAEPVNATVRLYLPPYVEFDKVISNNATVVGTVAFIPEAGGLDIVFPKFLFSDTATVVVGLLADPNYKRGFGRGEENATTPYRVFCTQTFRHEPEKNPETPDTIVSCGPVDYIMYVVNSQECYKPLGLSSPKKIYKCQLSASSSAKKETGPYNIRMGSRRGWSPALRIGPHKPYFQVDFLRTTRVSKIEFAKVAETRSVTRYRLQYSHTGSDWLYANDVTAIVYKRDNKAVDELKNPIQTRFIRVIVEEAESEDVDSQYIGLKMELYGCYLAEKLASVSCSKEDPTWYSDDKNTYGRHFSVDTNKDIAYLCDLEYDMETLVCYTTTDAGSSWRTLPRSFGGVIGYDRKASRTYAFDKRKRAYIASDDGITWVSVEFNVVNNTLAKKSFFRSQPVPAFTTEDIQNLETKTGRWEATFDGLMYEGKSDPRARWSKCCKLMFQEPATRTM